MQSLLNTATNLAHSVGETLTPVLTESAFMEKGVMTPEEFVAAGDKLVALSHFQVPQSAHSKRLHHSQAPPSSPSVHGFGNHASPDFRAPSSAV